MLLMLKYQGYQKADVFFLALPLLFSILLLYIIASIIYWGGPSSLYSIVSSSEVLYAVKLSLLTAFTSTSLALATGIPLAYALSRYRFKGKSIIETILLLPFAMPPVALGAVLLIFFTNTWVGAVLNNLLRIVFEIPGLIVAQYTVILPMIVRVLKSTFDLVDVKYEFVARTLGYSRASTLYLVLLPMARSGVASAYILGFTRALGEFGASVTLAGATRFKTETLPIAIYLTLSSGEIQLTIALITLLVIVSFIILLVLNIVDKFRKISLV